MIKEAIYEIVNGKNLSYDSANAAMLQIMEGQATNAQIGGFLAALRLKGETVEEITACAAAMRSKGLKVQHHNTDVLEIVGTGGDEANTFNISTTASLVVAAAGAAVAKHGNRSVSSKCGAADCLEALGVKLELTAEKNESILKNVGMCFMYAPVYHSSMKYAAPVRKELGIRTIFNILGPLSNPAAASIQLMGVYDKKLVEPMARVLNNLGVKRGAVVYGDGLDEITACGKTTVCEINNGKFSDYEIDPADYNFTYAKLSDLVGGDGAENAIITKKILQGEQGAKRNAVLLNAGMSIYLAGKAENLAAGINKAAEIIDSGAAQQKLTEFIAATNEV
ncbi:anthranilate phosphoribosyltransferase [Pectinatus brassicae]|uniref:Anthranilate phosphoribosyltransferase n=1 Tax=Pectinatus brassicae TaxID=862415 RepID=A0A840UYN2_9FIRM|nr:anthranilate phosphoribosyltransferase [Pectinatus brassicae]MBB5337475.1 anthranilate phosphoribosyltransferase [Pectinatus brassicae]